MAALDFPIVSTKKEGLSTKFNLADPKTRSEYFQAKVGAELAQIRDYLQKNQFIGYFIGKKNSGKGTYSKLFSEALGSETLVHLSVGDLVRETHANWSGFIASDKGKKLKSLYRGFLSFEEAEQRFISRDASKLLPSEFIVALLRVKFEELEGKSVFLDGFPREEDQMAYSMFFKEIVNRPNDKDMLILIDIPNEVINERIKYRVICPICNTPRNPKLLVTSKVGFDKETNEFYLMCDNPGCNEARMVRKEGDDLGIGPIKDRLEKDQQILEKAYSLQGMPKVTLRNCIPVDVAKENFDDYEITPAYSFELASRSERTDDQIKVIENLWVVKDDKGVDSYSLLPTPVVVGMIKQMAKILKND